MQKLGQHFLKNNAILDKIAGAVLNHLPLAAYRLPLPLILEIGPGRGELTQALRKQNSEIKIIAVEKDRVLAANLKKKFQADSNVEIVTGDIRNILSKDFSQYSISDIQNPFIICGNIPYYLTSYLFRLIEHLPLKPERCVFTVQKEVAERVVAAAPYMNKLAAAVQFWGTPKILLTVSRNEFSPPPKVDSAVLQIDVPARIKRSAPDSKKYYETLLIIFRQPRKTIENNLLASKKFGPRGEITAILRELNLNPAYRPQNLSVKNLIDLSRRLPSNL